MFILKYINSYTRSRSSNRFRLKSSNSVAIFIDLMVVSLIYEAGLISSYGGASPDG